MKRTICFLFYFAVTNCYLLSVLLQNIPLILLKPLYIETSIFYLYNLQLLRCLVIKRTIWHVGTSNKKNEQPCVKNLQRIFEDLTLKPICESGQSSDKFHFLSVDCLEPIYGICKGVAIRIIY